MVIKVDVWSDFICPFCYIGKRRLEMAVSHFAHGNQVEVEFKSFELDPNSPKETSRSIHEVLADRYGMSIDEARRTNISLAKHAETIGLTYKFDTMKPTNTFDAHRLVKFAKSIKKDSELIERLFYAYFTESKNISDFETLAKSAESVGISRVKALDALQDSSAFANDVRIDESIAQQIGITGVPFFVVNQSYSISGAQPTTKFVDALNKAWKELVAPPVLRSLPRKQIGNAKLSDNGWIIPEKNE